MRLAVQPARKGGFVPPHPLDGEMPPEGAKWLADQHTLCLLRDGVIKRTPEDAEDGQSDEGVAPKAKTEPAAHRAPRRTAKPKAVAKAETAAASASAEAPQAAEPPADPAPRVADAI